MKISKFGIFFSITAGLLAIICLLREYQVLPSFINASTYQLLPVEKQQDHKFVFIIPMYNHSNITQKMLLSIAEQTYPHYRVLCIDDGSPFPSKETVLNFLEHSDVASKFHYVEYAKHRGAIERLYEAVQQCEDEEIVVFFEGNSWLSDKTVLEKLNNLYKKYDVWLAYTEVKNARTGKPSNNRPLNSQNFFSSSMRRKYWQMVRFKTFYARLFKNIKMEDLFFRGKFIDDRSDQAYMFPMMEMAAQRAVYFPEICLTYVQDDSFTKIERPSFTSQRKCLAHITSTLPYEPLNELFFHPPENTETDLIIFSYDRPLQLHALLESVERYMKGYHKIFVIYKTSNFQYEKGFQSVKRSFPFVQFIHQAKNAQDFHPILLQVLQKASPYILFSVDDMVIKDNVHLKEAITYLESTNAYSFSLRLGEHINYCYMGDFPSEVPDHVYVSPKIFGWQINSARGDWTYPNSLDMTIYRRDRLIQDFSKIRFTNPNELEVAWNHSLPKRELRKIIGLCYAKSKAVNIPLNQVFLSENRNANMYQKEDLLEKYLQGVRIDISPLFQMKNLSVHLDYQPTFIDSKGKVMHLKEEGKEKSSPSEN